MPGPGQIDNPKGAFGYPGGANTTAAQALMQGGYAVKIETVRNASTVSVIPRGAAVAFSTLSSVATEVACTTVIGSPLFRGVALTSAGLNTERTSVTTAVGLGEQGSDWCDIAIEGPVHGALLSSGVTAGETVWIGSSTVAGATTNGGYLTSTNVLSSAAGRSAIAGIALTSATTGTTGFLTTTGPRGIVYLRPSFVQNSTL